MKKKARKRTQANNLVRSIGKIIEGRDALARQAQALYTAEVEEILLAQSHDAQRIRGLLDHILDFCFDPAMLALFKKFCRYYYRIDPVATAAHVVAYREMWDEADAKTGSRKRSTGKRGRM